jgi:hypothetical protein
MRTNDFKEDGRIFDVGKTMCYENPKLYSKVQLGPKKEVTK